MFDFTLLMANIWSVLSISFAGMTLGALSCEIWNNGDSLIRFMVIGDVVAVLIYAYCMGWIVPLI